MKNPVKNREVNWDKKKQAKTMVHSTHLGYTFVDIIMGLMALWTPAQ